MWKAGGRREARTSRASRSVNRTAPLLPGSKPVLAARRIEIEFVMHDAAVLAAALGARVRGRLLSLAIAARQPATLERAPYDSPNTEALAHREDVTFGISREDRIRRLDRNDAIEAAAPGAVIVLAGMKAQRAIPNFISDKIPLKALRIVGV